MKTPTKTKLAILIVSTSMAAASSSSSVFGAVVPCNHIVRPSAPYIVPTGKTLIFDVAVMTQGNGPANIQILVPGASGNEFFNYSATNALNHGNHHGVGHTMHFAGGTRFQVPSGLNFSFIVIGKLADDADLFACVPSTLGPVQDSPDDLRAVAKVSSPRPVRIEVEESTNLATWVVASAAQVVKQAIGEYAVSVPKAGAARKFVRAKARVRPSS